MNLHSAENRRLVTTWVMLALFSLATTALTLTTMAGNARYAVGLGVLLLAGAKARFILQNYLKLRTSSFWTRAFDLLIGLFLALAFALFVAAR